MMKWKNRVPACVGLVFTLFNAGPLHAQAQKLADGYPNKPIRFLVASIPGAASDVVVRLVAPKVSERLDKPLVIENRGGGNGIPALNAAAQSAPDGYTILNSGNLLVLNGVTGKLSYDIRKTFDPIVLLSSQPYILIAHPSVPANSVKELVALAKGKPGAVSYGSSGLGAVNHLGMALLAHKSGVDMLHVPYKGNAQAIPDLISGRIHILFAAGPSSAPHIKSGKVKALAVSSLKRAAAFPDLAPVSDTLSGFELTNAYSVYAPAGTPQAILQLLNKEFTDAANAPDVRAKLTPAGMDMGPGTLPAALKDAFIREYDVWDNFLRTSGIKLQN